MSALSSIVEKVANALEGAGTTRAALAIEPRHVHRAGDWPLPGLPGVAPLWADGTWSFGLLAMPHLDAANWPGVMVWREQAITIASTPATLLPRYLVERHLSNFPDRANALARNWGSIEHEVRALHAALGGRDASLSTFADVLLDDQVRPKFAYSPSSRAEFEAAHEALFRAIDPSPEFAAFADWFSARLQGASMPPQPQVCGNWSRQALAWSLQFGVASGALGDDFGQLAPLVVGHAGWDTGVSAQPSWHDPASGGSLGLVAMTAQLIETEPPLADPVDRLLVRAVAQAGTGYDGIAHAEAAPVLDEQGNVERAWAALCAAAWWMQADRGKMPSAILDGTRLIASHHGAADMLWLVDEPGRAPL
jgi:hypothetical protein